MRIGILTFHRAVNYGAALQAYSLLRYLSRQCHDVVLIDYYPREDEKDYDIFRSMISLKNVLYNFLVFPYSIKIRRKKQRFFHFIQEYTVLTRRYYHYEELCSETFDLDAVITGSDQVFNPVSDDNIKIYYLAFVSDEVRRISYAPSFGMNTFTDDLGTKIKPYLTKFHSINCREQNGADYIAKITETDCPVVIDPVFLTSQKDWNLFVGTETTDDGYIFVYDLNGRDRLISLANRLKEKTGLPIKCISTKKYFTKKYDVDELILDAGPIEFIQSIAKANYVLTDSFHGMSFALIYRKKFIACNALKHASGRLSSLLMLLKLQYRLVSLEDYMNTDISVIDTPMDYDELLNEYIDKSKGVLDKSLS